MQPVRQRVTISNRRYTFTSRPGGFSPLGRTKSTEHTFKNEAEPQNHTGAVHMVDEEVDEAVTDEVSDIDDVVAKIQL